MATKLYLPNLLEFIYHTITEKGFTHLFNRLDREDFLKVKNESRARSFAEFGNIEDKMIIMSKLGMGCAIVFWDKEKEKKKKVEDVVIAYLETDETNLTKQMVKDKSFACRDIDFIKSLQTMSRSSMSKVYSVSRRFLQIKDSSEGIKTRTLVNKFTAERNLDWYSNTIQFALDIEPILEPFKINMVQFRILLYLQVSPNGMTKDTLAKKINRLNVSGSVNELFDYNMVSFTDTNKNIVTIDVYGIIILEQIMNKFP